MDIRKTGLNNAAVDSFAARTILMRNWRQLEVVIDKAYVSDRSYFLCEKNFFVRTIDS